MKRIRKTYNGVVPNGKILNSYSDSQNDGYSCDYINGLYKDDYELTISYPHNNNVYTACKIGNIVFISGVILIDGGVTANSSKVIGQVPNDLKPSKVMRSSATFFDGNGDALGYGSIRVDTEGNIRAMCSSSYQYLFSTNFSLIYKID